MTERKSFLKKLEEYDGRTVEERIYAIVNHCVDFFITAVIVVAMILGGYSFYISQRQLHNAGAGYAGYTMEQLGAIGWLTIDHTDIDYPVMQGKTNTEYLNKNPLGQISVSGSIFLDSASKNDFSDPYSVIYGHHMAQGKMFGALDSFQDFSYLKSHSSGTLKAAGGKAYSLHIFACISASAKNQTIFDVQRRDRKSVQNLIDRKAEGRILEYDRNADMIALSTCQDTESVERTVVFATIKSISHD